jgi:hypothetical protein
MRIGILSAILLSLAVLSASAACLDLSKACAIPQKATNYTRMAQQNTCCCPTFGGGQCCGQCVAGSIPWGCSCSYRAR